MVGDSSGVFRREGRAPFSSPTSTPVARRICVDLEPGRRVKVVGRLQDPRSERHDVVVGGSDVVDEKVEMDLLRGAMGPLGRDVDSWCRAR